MERDRISVGGVVVHVVRASVAGRHKRWWGQRQNEAHASQDVGEVGLTMGSSTAAIVRPSVTPVPLPPGFPCEDPSCSAPPDVRKKGEGRMCLEIARSPRASGHCRQILSKSRMFQLTKGGEGSVSPPSSLECRRVDCHQP